METPFDTPLLVGGEFIFIEGHVVRYYYYSYFLVFTH